jgi:ABC-type antimicrobial peptide transport system permease subunit
MSVLEQTDETAKLRESISYDSNDSTELLSQSERVEKEERLKAKVISQKTSYYLKSSFKDIWRHKVHFCISTLSIFIVVLMALVIYSIIDKAPVIFLRLSEKNSGEIDAILEPQLSLFENYYESEIPFAYFNYTKIQELLPDINLSPRKLMDGEMHGDKHGNSNWSSNVNILFSDTDREKKIRLGKNYKFPKLVKNQWLISAELVKVSKHSKGDTVKFSMSLYNILKTLTKRLRAEEDPYFQSLLFYYTPLTFEWSILDTFNSTMGKFDEGIKDNLIILELDSLFFFLKNAVKTYVTESDIKMNKQVTQFLDFLDKSSPREYVDQIVMTFHEPRMNFYNNPDFNKLMADTLQQMNGLEEKLGYYPIEIYMPILGQLQQYNLATLFMGLLFSMILALFVVISIILVYSLLLVNVQQKSFEIGIKRMVGETKTGLVKDVVIQTFFFSIPGIVLAFLWWFPTLRLIYYYEFELKLNLKMDPNPTKVAILNGFFLGIIIPLVSSFMPIKAALSQNLNDALDYTRSQTKAVVIQIIDPQNQNIGISVIFGAISTMYGIAIYILLPQWMMSLDFGLMLKIFFLILIGLLLGLILIATNIQFIIEIIITKLFFWWEKQSIWVLILKNLVAHRLRNSYTSLVYALSLSFLILWVVSYSLQIQNVKLIETKIFNEIEVRKYGGVDVNAVEDVLKKYEERVKVFGYRTYYLTRWKNTDAFATSHSRFRSQQIRPIAVSPGLIDSFEQDYIQVKYEHDSGLSLSEQLYTQDGSHSAGIGTYLAKSINLLINEKLMYDEFFMNFDYELEGSVDYFKMRPKFILDETPTLKMGKRKLTKHRNILLSIPSAMGYTGNLDVDIDLVKYYSWFVKLKEGISIEQRTEVINALKSVGQVKDVDSMSKNLEEVTQILDVIFTVIISLSMFLWFFSLVSSTSANMMEQTKEIGVLRAIGYTKYMIKRLYFYETFVLVFASSCLGIIVGTFVGWTMTIQQADFISIPIIFYFPYKHLAAASVVSMIWSFIAIYSPITFILSNQISEIFRLN